MSLLPDTFFVFFSLHDDLPVTEAPIALHLPSPVAHVGCLLNNGNLIINCPTIPLYLRLCVICWTPHLCLTHLYFSWHVSKYRFWSSVFWINQGFSPSIQSTWNFTRLSKQLLSNTKTLDLLSQVEILCFLHFSDFLSSGSSVLFSTLHVTVLHILKGCFKCPCQTSPFPLYYSFPS